MSHNKITHSNYPSAKAGLSYHLPDGSWVNIPLGSLSETIQAGQAEFWIAWANEYSHHKTHNKPANKERLFSRHPERSG